MYILYSAKFWRIDRFRVLAGENVGDFAVAYISYCSESGIWLGKILANGVSFAKSAKVFPCQEFRYTVHMYLHMCVYVCICVDG